MKYESYDPDQDTSLSDYSEQSRQRGEPSMSLDPCARLTAIRHVDFGSGPNPPNGFVGVDSHVSNERVVRYDVIDRFWPFVEGQFERLRASHFIEHIPATNAHDYQGGELRHVDALVLFFERAYRSAQIGASFELVWPALRHENAFRDPTHRRFIPLGMLDYLSVEGRRLMGVEHYDFRCNWVVEDPKDITMVFDERQKEVFEAGDSHLLWNVATEYRVKLVKYTMGGRAAPNHPQEDFSGPNHTQDTDLPDPSAAA